MAYNKHAFPELAAAKRRILGPWTVSDNPPFGKAGQVDLLNRTYEVETRGVDAIAIRRHELSHIAHSPLDPTTICAEHEILIEALQVVEDTRVNLLAADCGMPVIFSPATVKADRKGLKSMPVESAIRFCVSRWSTHGMSRYLGRIPSLKPYRSTIRAICLQIGKRNNRQSIEHGLINPAKALTELLRRLARQDEIHVLRQVAADKRGIPDQPGNPSLDGDHHSMIVVDVLPKTVNLFKPGQIRSTDCGQHVRTDRLAQAMVGGNVFRCRSPRVGNGCGTLLVDASGSCGLRAEEIRNLCTALPYATVALHSCDEGYAAVHKADAVLRILARHGKIATRDPYSFLSGNGADYPAVRWLACQPGPRYYLGDVGVSGKRLGNDAVRRLIFLAARAAGIFCADIDRLRRLPVNAWARTLVRRDKTVSLHWLYDD